MEKVYTVKEVREQVKAWRREGLTVGLVPTMGYLHEGHASLIKKAVEQNDKVVVSVFCKSYTVWTNRRLRSLSKRFRGRL